MANKKSKSKSSLLSQMKDSGAPMPGGFDKELDEETGEVKDLKKDRKKRKKRKEEDEDDEFQMGQMPVPVTGVN